jgi:hypothetical protein
MKINVNNFTLLAFSFTLILIASLLIGAFGEGGGCLGTQTQIHTVGGSSGIFTLVEPANYNPEQIAEVPIQPIFSWTRYPADLTSYTLQISTDVNFLTFIYTRTNIAPSATSFPATIGPTYPITLTADTFYHWRITAVDSDTGTQTIASNAPFKFKTGSMPTSFNLSSPASGTAVTSTTPTLAWTKSSGTISYYYVEIDNEFNFYDPIAYTAEVTPPTTTPPITHTVGTNPCTGSLMDGTIYYWRVIAIGSGGSKISGPSPYYWSFTTP